MVKRKRTPDTQSGRQRRPRPPSAAVLTLLASVAGSTPVAAATPTLDFLYPTLAHDPPPEHRRRDASFPAKYEAGDDGQWRKVDRFTLYGSTVCTSSSSQCAALEASSSRTTSSAMATGANGQLLDTLPLGWGTKKPASDKDTNLILALSLVVAFVICFCMIGCIFVRKTRRKKKYPVGDIEMKGIRRRRRRERPEEVSLVEKEVRAQKKLWAKASARWKANARLTARQRRGPFTLYRSEQARPSSTSLRGSIASPPIRSVSPSIPSSPRSSISVSAMRDSSTNPTSPSPMSSPRPLSSNSAHTNHLRLSSPPAYHHPQPTNNIAADVSPDPSTVSTGCDGHSSSRTHNRQPSSSDHDESGSCPVHSHTAHVATDDKARLAHLASMASAPTQHEDAAHFGDLSSAPEWQDEDPVDFTAGSSRPTSGTFSAGEVFPPEPANFLPRPPEKAILEDPSAHLSELQYELDNLGLGGPLGPCSDASMPSAPPFEETASAPPLEGHLIPSAPPLDEDDLELEYVDDRPEERQPCEAPTSVAQMPEGAPTSEQIPYGQDHDRQGRTTVSPPGYTT